MFLLLSFIGLCYVAWSVVSYLRLRHIPGPTLWAITRLPLIRIHLIGDIYNRFYDFNNRYGPLVRIGPNQLLCSDPEVIRRMNAPKSPYKRSSWYVILRMSPGIDSMPSEPDDEKHAQLRKKAAPAYNGRESGLVEHHIDSCILDFVRLVETKYIDAQGKSIPMELAQKIQYLATDIGSLLGIGTNLNDLRDDRDNFGYIREFTTTWPKVSCTGVFPEVIHFFTDIGLLKFLDPVKSGMALGRVVTMCRAEIASRRGLDGKMMDNQDDMLSSFLRHNMTLQEVEQEAVILMIAGLDTVAGALRGTIRCLLTHPAALQKLTQEIDKAVQENQIPSGKEEVVSDAQVKRMPYVQAVIKEGLRWQPPIVGMMSKDVPRGGDEICGYRVPEGTHIAYSGKALHRNPNLFSPDPHAFRPERWLHTSQGGDEPSMEKIKEMERNNDLIFGWGKNQCMGKNIAFTELNKILVEFFRRFEFDLIDKKNPMTTTCYSVHIQAGLWVRMKKRDLVPSP